MVTREAGIIGPEGDVEIPVRFKAGACNGSGDFLLMRYSVPLNGEVIFGCPSLNIVSQSGLCAGILA